MDPTASRNQQTALVVLRTLIGWHFLYEGFAKVADSGVEPGRASRSAASPPRAICAARAVRSRTSSGAWPTRAWLPWLDLLVAWGLVLIGLGLMLGLFTQLACAGALALLALFYLSWLPTSGVREAGAEGAYLLVNKNLIEAAAVAVVLAFRTDRIAGLDLLRAGERARRRRPSRRPRDEPHPGAAGARTPQLHAGSRGNPGRRRARRGRRRQGSRARRARAPRLHRRRRPGPHAARADRPAVRARSWRSATSTRCSSQKADESLAKTEAPAREALRATGRR